MNPLVRLTPEPGQTLEQSATVRALSRKLASVYEDIVACIPDCQDKTDALNALVNAGNLVNKGITHGTT